MKDTDVIQENYTSQRVLREFDDLYKRVSKLRIKYNDDTVKSVETDSEEEQISTSYYRRPLIRSNKVIKTYDGRVIYMVYCLILIYKNK